MTAAAVENYTLRTRTRVSVHVGYAARGRKLPVTPGIQTTVYGLEPEEEVTADGGVYLVAVT